MSETQHKNWCKLFDTEIGQLLVQRMSDHENGEHLRVSASLNGFVASLSLGYEDDEEKADDEFNSVTLEELEPIIEAFKGLQAEINNDEREVNCER